MKDTTITVRNTDDGVVIETDEHEPVHLNDGQEARLITGTETEHEPGRNGVLIKIGTRVEEIISQTVGGGETDE